MIFFDCADSDNSGVVIVLDFFVHFKNGVLIWEVKVVNVLLEDC